MSKRKFAQIDGMLGQEPRTIARSGNVVLDSADGKKRITLADSKGLTKLGKRFYEKSNRTFSKNYDSDAPLVRIKKRIYNL